MNANSKNIGFLEFAKKISLIEMDITRNDLQNRNVLFQASHFEDLGVLKAIGFKYPKLLNQLD